MFYSAKEIMTWLKANPSGINHLYGYSPAIPLRKYNYDTGAYYPDPPVTATAVRAAMKEIRRRILTRPPGAGAPAKFLRPWTVVPHLANFQVPDGDFGVGIEVEYGFRTLEDFQFIADKIKDWKYITLDMEGGRIPLEVTFPPTLYSKWGHNSQAMRYLHLLKKEVARTEHRGNSVGTHVNISAGGRHLDSYRHRVDDVNSFLRTMGLELCRRYFNRVPYGYLYIQAHGIEYKLFNSEPEPKQLIKYVEVAISIHRLLLADDVPVTAASVRLACEAGYLKACKKNRTKPVPYPLEVTEDIAALTASFAA